MSLAVPQRHWWQQRQTVIALTLIAVMPLVWPAVPPLIDLPGHMGRYAVELHPDRFAGFYSFKWQLIGNLGIDLLIIPVSKIFGLELGVKLIVMTIPALTVAGLMWIAREVHGDVPPTTLFALPFAYGHPFTFGFVNFALSMGLGLCAFALWLRLARTGHLRLRAMVFTLIAPLLWLTHTFGWAALGVMAFSAELIRQHDRRADWPRAIFWAGVHCIPLSPPMLLMLIWRSGHVGGTTGDWFNWQAKREWLITALRDRWERFDMLSLLLAVAVWLWALVSPAMEMSRNLRASALFLLAVFLLLPRIVFGSAYADMRLVPYMLAIAIIAIRPRRVASPRLLAGVAALGLVFVLVRLGANTVSYALYDSAHRRALAALDHIPDGARVASFVRHKPCGPSWATSRMEHVPSLIMVRRNGFSNDQWEMPGAQLIHTTLAGAGRFASDPSQIITADDCPSALWRSIDTALRDVPRDAFDYVWLIDPPRYDPANTRGLNPVWRSGDDVLFKVNHDGR